MEKKTMFFYIVIVVLIIYYMTFFNFGINVLVGIIVSYFIIGQLDKTRIMESVTYSSNINKQIESIKPKINKIKKEEELLNLLFSIQDLYIYNPEVYGEMTKNIEDFLKIYDFVTITPKMTSYYYDIMTDKKNRALNLLMALIISTPSNQAINNKLGVAVDTLEDILNKKLDIVYNHYQEDIYINGLHAGIKHVYIGPKPSNSFDNQIDKINSNSYEVY